MTATAVDVRSLEAALAAAVTGEVRFGDGDRALYSTDGSNYRQVPIGVVVPRSVDDVVSAVAACHAHGAPVLSRGGGTSLAGQCCNVAVVIDWSKYLHGIISVDPGARRARVQPGCVLDDLRGRAEGHNLTFGADPATHNHCTLGGMIGNNSCGVHSVMAGRTVDNVASLEVLTYDGLRFRVGATSEDELAATIAAGGRKGEIYAGLAGLRDRYADEIRRRYPRIPRRVSGYNLDELLPENGFNVARALVGTEGTCVTVLEAEVQLVPSPPARALLVLGYPDVYTAADHIELVMEAGPTGCEGIDHELFTFTEQKHLHPAAMKLFPSGNGFLLVEFGGDTNEEAEDRARALMGRLEREGDAPAMRVFSKADEQVRVWGVRESGLGATARDPLSKKSNWPGWEDSAVPPERLGDYLRDLRKLFARFGYAGALYGHFGQGCIHTRINFDLRDADGIATYRGFVEEAADLVVSYGGSLSGEHGDGQSRGELLSRMFGDDLVRGFEEFKAIWDPDDRMNPGKVVRPYRIDENLRLGTTYRPWEPATNFSYTEDEYSFSRATLRCVGVGRCRREGGGTMCPSYMVTREEKHSTRGRARLLFEMLQGEVITEGWRSEAVRDALDLCLACKGCKNDCPVNVDMATYKAEFLSHHYAGRFRPAAHYSMGWLPLAARVAARAPRLVNALTHAPGLGALAKRIAGVAPERTIPRFARRTFQDWFSAHGPPNGSGSEVLVWPDTFTNHFDPQIGRSAVAVLADAGFRVTVPSAALCCGLTWISTGQLKTARRVLRRTIDALAPYVERGVPIVGLEPSCTAVFRSDLAELFPHDEDAKRLGKLTFTLAELLTHRAGGWERPHLARRAIVQGHCHHKSIMQMSADEQLYGQLGLDADVLDSGCCGLAGNFGFERGHYDVSIACGERVLLPEVRNAAPETIVMADGFSCRTQIRENTDRRALHLAEVLEMGIREGEEGVSPRRYPEQSVIAGTPRGRRPRRGRRWTALPRRDL